MLWKLVPSFPVLDGSATNVYPPYLLYSRFASFRSFTPNLTTRASTLLMWWSTLGVNAKLCNWAQPITCFPVPVNLSVSVTELAESLSSYLKAAHKEFQARDFQCLSQFVIFPRWSETFKASQNIRAGLDIHDSTYCGLYLAEIKALLCSWTNSQWDSSYLQRIYFHMTANETRGMNTVS